MVSCCVRNAGSGRRTKVIGLAGPCGLFEKANLEALRAVVAGKTLHKRIGGLAGQAGEPALGSLFGAGWERVWAGAAAANHFVV